MQMDVMRVGQLLVIEEGDPVPVGKKVEPKTEFTWLELS